MTRRFLIWLHWHTVEAAIITLTLSTAAAFSMEYVLGGLGL